MKPYGIFFNPNAGSGESEKIANQLKTSLAANDIDSFFITGKDADEAIEAVMESLEKIDSLVSIGGDGSLNIVGTAFIRSGKTVPLGIIPGGTINNFAKRWNISLDTQEAINTIINKKTRKVSIGKCNDQAIISSFTFGELADISNEVRQSEKRKYGLVVYPYKALKHIGKKTSYLVRYKTEKETQELKTWVALVTTTSYIGGLPYVAHDENSFNMSILNNMSFSKLLAYGRLAFTGKLKGKKSLTYINAEKIELTNLESNKEIKSRIDGDPGPSLPLTLEWQKDLIDLIVP